MSSPARMLTGHPATDDVDSSIGTDTETTLVPVMMGYSDSARSLPAYDRQRHRRGLNHGS